MIDKKRRATKEDLLEFIERAKVGAFRSKDVADLDVPYSFSPTCKAYQFSVLNNDQKTAAGCFDWLKRMIDNWEK